MSSKAAAGITAIDSKVVSATVSAASREFFPSIAVIADVMTAVGKAPPNIMAIFYYSGDIAVCKLNSYKQHR